MLSVVSDDELMIRVRGFQWWWDVTYLAATPKESFRTANEIHIPINRTVRIQLETADVIHSFWVPSLAGKQDLIPGRNNDVRFSAARAGTYRGQCAEFCGLQHADYSTKTACGQGTEISTPRAIGEFGTRLGVHAAALARRQVAAFADRP